MDDLWVLGAERHARVGGMARQVNHAPGPPSDMAAEVEWTDYPGEKMRRDRVAGISVAIAGQLGFAKRDLAGVHLCALLHDIGELVLPVAVLACPRPLTDDEIRLVRTHPHVGYAMVKDVAFSGPVARTVLEHHERLNGSGYPRGLVGEQICREARIIAVADVVEAMTADRPYRPALGIDATMSEVTKNCGKLYDCAVVDACVRLFGETDFARAWGVHRTGT